MFTPVASPISFRKAVSVKSVPQPSVQRTIATVKVGFSSATARPQSARLRATISARIMLSFFIVVTSFYFA